MLVLFTYFVCLTQLTTNRLTASKGLREGEQERACLCLDTAVTQRLLTVWVAITATSALEVPSIAATTTKQQALRVRIGVNTGP